MAGKYLLVKLESGDEQVVYSHATQVVYSNKDQNVVVAEPTGGEAVIHGTIVKELG